MNKVEEFMEAMEKAGDGGWPYETAAEYVGSGTAEEAIQSRLAELDQFNSGIQTLIDAGYDLEDLLRKPEK